MLKPTLNFIAHSMPTIDRCAVPINKKRSNMGIGLLRGINYLECIPVMIELIAIKFLLFGMESIRADIDQYLVQRRTQKRLVLCFLIVQEKLISSASNTHTHTNWYDDWYVSIHSVRCSYWPFMALNIHGEKSSKSSWKNVIIHLRTCPGNVTFGSTNYLSQMFVLIVRLPVAIVCFFINHSTPFFSRFIHQNKHDTTMLCHTCI